ncbi:uncharacterized protein LOC113240352 [Hyposmocoma kahamanoa]|uniref:uncharacterized protein LOC113240352 n=1 Tax=Hyposmocoma kahamanoa TaxID=1477025 RepID=UPI000E6D8454|nr:uncharacterized protein LOC113240352 [Hyposmocoma kahamanoa]
MSIIDFSIHSARFVWIRYNAVNVINPELVTESNTFRVHPNFNANTGANNIGLVSVNRFVESTDTIAPVALSRDAEVPESTILCIWGEDDDGEDVPGEQLQCNEVNVYEEEEEGIVAHGNIAASRFDLGTPLVSDGVQIAYMVAPTAGNYISGKYIRPDVDWINSITGLDL